MTLAAISWHVDTRREVLGIPWFPHGVLIAVGFLAGSWLLIRRARRQGLDVTALGDVLTWVLLGSLIGMRLVWVMGHWSHLHSPFEVVMVWHGGMSLYGGILGGLLAGVIMLRRSGLPVLPMLDLATPGLALGIAIGRLSDLIIGDHLGESTSLPWGFRYVGHSPPGAAPPLGAVVHPVALYDLVSALVLFGVLLAFLRRPRAVGSAAALFAVWYAAGRLVFDFARTDPVRALGMSGTQLASLAVIGLVGTWLVQRRRALVPAVGR